MTTAYGVPADAVVLTAIKAAQERMGWLIEAASAGAQRDEALRQNSHERDWMRTNGLLLIA